MIPASDLLLIPLSIGALLAVMAAVKYIGPRFGLTAELQRKLVHISTGLYALTLPYTFQSRGAVLLLLALSLLVLLVLRLPTFAKGGIASAVHGVKRRSHGEIYLTLAVGLIYWFSADNLALYVLPILVLTLSDAAAAMAGTRYGTHHFEVEAGTKSWEGVTMFFMVTWILAMVVLLLMTDIDRGRVIVLSVLIAGFGALVEADSWRGLDNLFVPAGVHFLLATHFDTPTLHLVIVAAGFLLALLFVAPLGEMLGLKPHSSRAYLVLIFLITAVTAYHNALIPLLAVLAHVAARTRAASYSPFADLDLIAVSAGVALIWLFTGEFFAVNALNVYNLTFAGMAVAFVALSVQADKKPRRAAISLGGAAIMFALVLFIASLNPSSVRWHGTFWPWALASIGLCLGAAWFAPELLNRARSLRVAGVAILVPLVLFLTKGLFA